ncbi:MAG: hypothetical protein Q6J68_02805 [Thermostichales cyanobacterium SZTDM-1c_bins_54]
MARYSHMAEVVGSLDQVRAYIPKLLQECQLDVLHSSRDYWVAGEKPGQVPYGQLVRVEVLLDQPQDNPNVVHITCIAKNEELPLQNGNHCQRVFGHLTQELGRLAEILPPPL